MRTFLKVNKALFELYRHFDGLCNGVKVITETEVQNCTSSRHPIIGVYLVATPKWMAHDVDNR